MGLANRNTPVNQENLLQVVAGMSQYKQQEVFLFVQALQEEEAAAISPELEKEHLKIVEERLAKAKANPETMVEATTWLQQEADKRGW